MKIYCMSDIHGWLSELDYALFLIEPHLAEVDTKLVLLGDYIHGPDSYGVLDRIIALQDKWGRDKVIALRGNHEDMACSGSWPIGAECYALDQAETEKDGRYLAWMECLPFYYSEGNIIFVHAGIDEELGELWEWTDEYTCMWHFPAQTGKFCGNWKIMAGHVSTAQIAGDRAFHDIYFDGEAHYYIDGTVQVSGVIPILMADTDTGKFYRVTESGPWAILPYGEY